MLKLLFLIFEPDVAWEKIALARRGMLYILGVQLLPLIALATVPQGWALMHWGKWQSHFDKTRIFTDLAVVVHFEILQALLFLAVIFLSALLMHLGAASFHGRRTYLQSFTLIAYAFSPMLVAHVLNIFPTMHPAIPWAIGLALTIFVLYQGVPRVLERDPVHSFGNYMTGVFVILLTSGLAQVLPTMFLLGVINFQHSAITRALGQWLGQ